MFVLVLLLDPKACPLDHLEDRSHTKTFLTVVLKHVVMARAMACKADFYFL